MINNVNNATSFKASYIDKINIQKLNNKNKYVPYQANLVELNLSDLKTLEEINKKWKNNWLCGEFINWAKSLHNYSDKLFALTTYNLTCSLRKSVRWNENYIVGLVKPTYLLKK